MEEKKITSTLGHTYYASWEVFEEIGEDEIPKKKYRLFIFDKEKSFWNLFRKAVITKEFHIHVAFKEAAVKIVNEYELEEKHTKEVHAWDGVITDKLSKPKSIRGTHEFEVHDHIADQHYTATQFLGTQFE